MTAFSAFFLPTSLAAGLSVGDLADRWISGACKLKVVRGLARVPERQFAAELIQSLALSLSKLPKKKARAHRKHLGLMIFPIDNHIKKSYWVCY